MIHSPLYYFTDAVLRAPTIGSMLMCLAASLVGVIVFLRKQSLLGESLSHAAYPGVVIGVAIAGLLHVDDQTEAYLTIIIMGGAVITALIGLWSIHFLEVYLKISSDSALCFILSAFFGIGLTIASQVQFSFSYLYRLAQSYLYGQAATMTDTHIFVYGALALVIVIVITFFYKEIKVICFSREYARSLDINVNFIETLTFILIVLAVVVGIRSVGVVLMSAMLISPAVAARQFTNKLSRMFLLAGMFGIMSGFFGNYLSIEASVYMKKMYSDASRLTLPTGPMIVLVASFLCLISLFFAPKRGLLTRAIRLGRFKFRCICENLLKHMWRYGPSQIVSIEQISKQQSVSVFYIRFVLYRLVKNGWVRKIKKKQYQLTNDGIAWAAKIVRLHRLWEVYLVQYIGVGAEKVHMSAEEMEHVITPELEKQLTLLLKNPKKDPHHQPIPPEVSL